MWIFAIVAFVASMVALSAAMKQQMSSPDEGEVDVPIVEEGKSIGVLFGRKKISGNCYWWGDLRSVEIKK